MKMLCRRKHEYGTFNTHCIDNLQYASTRKLKRALAKKIGKDKVNKLLKQLTAIKD